MKLADLPKISTKKLPRLSFMTWSMMAICINIRLAVHYNRQVVHIVYPEKILLILVSYNPQDKAPPVNNSSHQNTLLQHVVFLHSKFARCIPLVLCSPDPFR
jgi:hypothetical protein